VVGTTREGSLFVWRTSGGECGRIPWRNWHHDEWGTGNYHTDARPPAALAAADVTSIVPTSPNRIDIALARVPGDDLYCGTDATYDVRLSQNPIATEADFDGATPAALVTTTLTDTENGRSGGTLTIIDDVFANRSMYVALVSQDDQGNRSALYSFGSVTGPTAPPTTPPTGTPTSTRVPTITVAPTSTVAPTRTIAGQPTPVPAEDDSCHVTRSTSGGSWWWLAPMVLVVLRRTSSPDGRGVR
jgi:hypothetical protein